MLNGFEGNCSLIVPPESYHCASGSYKCHGVHNQMCVPQKQVCDGIRHCKEGDDELYCGKEKLHMILHASPNKSTYEKI